MSTPDRPDGPPERTHSVAADLVPFDLSSLGDDAVAQKLRKLVRMSIADSTRQVYARAIRTFEAWCGERGVPAFPSDPVTVARFLADENDRGKASTSLAVVLAAIRAAHRVRGHSSPTEHELVRRAMSGAARAARHPRSRKRPLTASRELDQVIGALDAELQDITAALAEPLTEEELRTLSTRREADIRRRKLLRSRLAAIRDRALLLVGFAGALRRSEISAIRVEDLRQSGHDLVLRVSRSKNDQAGQGRDVAILRGDRLCPIAALERWRKLAAIDDGPVFRSIAKGGRVSGDALSGGSIARLVKARAKAAGLDPNAFSGHSLRAGFLMSAARNGAPFSKMMDHAGHKTVDVTRGYVRDVELFENHAGKGLL